MFNSNRTGGPQAIEANQEAEDSDSSSEESVHIPINRPSTLSQDYQKHNTSKNDRRKFKDLEHNFSVTAHGLKIKSPKPMKTTKLTEN